MAYDGVYTCCITDLSELQITTIVLKFRNVKHERKTIRRLSERASKQKSARQREKERCQQ